MLRTPISEFVSLHLGPTLVLHTFGIRSSAGRDK